MPPNDQRVYNTGMCLIRVAACLASAAATAATTAGLNELFLILFIIHPRTSIECNNNIDITDEGMDDPSGKAERWWNDTTDMICLFVSLCPPGDRR